MAKKRMFDQSIIDSDAFLDMSLSTQALYFHLNMRADDEGFINNPKRIMRLIGCNDDDLKILIMKEFVITFESGIIVIKHWKINNYLRSDRFIKTLYEKEKKQIKEKNNGSYVLIDKGSNGFGIPNDNQMDTSGIHSIEEKSIEENRREEYRKNLYTILIGEFNREFNSFEIDQINGMCDLYTTKLVEYALRETVLQSYKDKTVISLKYMNGILKRWRAEGLTAEKYEAGET